VLAVATFCAIKTYYYYYYYYWGAVVHYRDICGCINLPVFPTETYTETSYSSEESREVVLKHEPSMDTYGKCFKTYQESNCRGFPTTVENIHVKWVYFKSVEPCQIPAHCNLR